jgi:hypothetical protein
MRTTVRRLMQEVVADQFSLDGKLPQTLQALFLKPGALTLAHLGGQGRRYVHPFRLYLFSSLLFFLLLGLSGTGARPISMDLREEQVPAEDLRQIMEREMARGEALNIGSNMGILNRVLETRAQQLLAMEPVEAGQELARVLIRNTPTLLFLLLPAFAGIYSLAYWRLRRFYMEHFITVLHLHAFVFATFSLQTLLTMVRLGWVNGVIQLWLWIYLFLALRRVYGLGWRKSLLKLVLIAVGYLMVLITAIPFLVLGSFIFWG